MSRHGHDRGSPPPPRLAATVILLRGGERKLELLLVRRSPTARFMGGVWVFPGGAVDDEDRPADGAALGEQAAEDRALRAAAVRELREEAGIELGAGAELVLLSRWITPAQVPVRFDTHFFLAELPRGQRVRVDGQECVDHRWLTPQTALDTADAGEIELVFPTIKHLQLLRSFESAAAMLEHAGGLEVTPVQPRIAMEGEVARVLLPDDPGY
jgi:8-oxo-dGTP pyrophosphatase MutT (NUDIX family)